MRTPKVLIGACSVLALVAACSGPQGDQDNTGTQAAAGTITIASNPPGTHVYAVAAGLAKLLQQELDVRATIRPFSGSSVYLPLLQRGELLIGLNTGIDSYLSYQGLPPWDSPMSNLRALGVMFPLNIMYMVRADSDFYRIEDLAGSNVVITFRANASLAQLHEGILATGGLTPDDVSAVTVAGLPEAMRALTEGRADATPTGLNTALSLQVNSALPGGVRYLTMGADEPRLSEIMPGSKVITVERDETSVGIEEPIRVSSVADFLNTGTHMPEEQAYEIVKTIYQSWEMLRRDHIQLAGTPADGIVPANLVHPYHAGAVRYYKEAGLWTDEHQANQARLLAINGQQQ